MEPLVCQGPFANIKFYILEGDDLGRVASGDDTTKPHRVGIIIDGWFSGKAHPTVISRTFGLDEIRVSA